MFGHRLHWYTIYTFSGAHAPDGILPHAKFTFRPGLEFSYFGSITARTPAPASAKFCGVVQGMELWNFRRWHHLYSAGRPARWASAHISSVVLCYADGFSA